MKLDTIIAIRNRKTIYRDGNVCIKTFDDSFKESDILNEALNQVRVQEAGLNVPKVLEVAKIEGRWAIVYEYVEGKTLAQLMEENPDKKDEYLEKFVDIQVEIQSNKCHLLNDLKAKMHRKINESDFNATTRYELHTRLNAMPTHDHICHGDFNPTNVVITEDGTPYVIDWSHVTQGNASADAARTYLLFWLNGDIEGAKKYLDLFCEKTDTAKQYVQKWMPIVAASQSVEGNLKEREFLHSWVHVVEYN